jgi:DNA (cytosine-5)-methyltransferase 1
MDMTLRAGSLFSGGGLMDYAVEQSGFRVAWQAEIDSDASDILHYHWPEVPNYGDITAVDPHRLAAVDLIFGGSPCQSFSSAGQREGLDGESGLFWEFLRIADSQPRAWILWENVPNVLSIDDGKTFALILWGFTGYWPQVPADGWRNSGICTGPKRTIAWRVLDAEYFGVPQKRYRIFIVGHPVDRTDCVEILFEPDSLSGNSASSTKTRQVAPSLLAKGPGVSRTGGSDLKFVGATLAAERDRIISIQLAHTAATNFLWDDVACTLDTGGSIAVYAPRTARTLTAGGKTSGRRREDDDNIVFAQSRDGSIALGGDGSGGIAKPLMASQGTEMQNYILPTSDDAMADEMLPMPRRLLPIEAERLQGIPDDWTRWRPNGQTLSDTARYRICGNGIAVPVVTWIAQRIQQAIDRKAISQETEVI